MGNEKEKAARIQDLLTICLATAINTALSSVRGYGWFQYFKNEEASRSDSKMIVRSYQNSLEDCDFQALLKILYFRNELSKEVLSYYGHPEAISSGKRDSNFRRTVGRLINDYRNNIAAHVSVRDLRQAQTGSSEGMFYNYSTAIMDMVSIAYVFSDVLDDDGIRYYDHIKDIVEGGEQKKSGKGWIIAAAAVFVLAAAVILYLRPWSGSSEEGSVLHIISHDTMDDARAMEIVQDFYHTLCQNAQEGNREAFGKLFCSDYSEAEIDEWYHRCLSDIKPEVFTYVDNAIAAYQVYNEQAELMTISRFQDGWKMGCFDTLEEKIREELKENFRDVLNQSPDQAEVRAKLTDDILDQGYYSDAYENAMKKTLHRTGISLKCIVPDPDDPDGWLVFRNIVNGTSSSISSIVVDSMKLIDDDTKIVLADLNTGSPVISLTQSVNAYSSAMDCIRLPISQLKEGININHKLVITCQVSVMNEAFVW